MLSQRTALRLLVHAKNLPNDMPMHIGEALIAAAVAEGEAGVVEAHLMKDGGVDEVVGEADFPATLNLAKCMIRIV